MRILKQALFSFFPILFVSGLLGSLLFILLPVHAAALKTNEVYTRVGFGDETVSQQVVTYTVYLPVVFKSPTPECPTYSSRAYNLIPVDGPPADHPDYLHGDLNLSLRGYSEVSEYLGLVDYNGGTDPDAPQLAGLFEPNRFPGITSTHRVNHWDWACNPPDGCRGSVITEWPVTLAGLTATPGEDISISERGPEIYGGGYIAMVLYAEERRITLGYTRQDTVASGYAVHIEDVCVDPNLLALYRNQVDADGDRATNFLPALRNNETLGTALNTEIKVAVRDRGAFMDPRSDKDWWQAYQTP
jgi:hypothetical protein